MSLDAGYGGTDYADALYFDAGAGNTISLGGTTGNAYTMMIWVRKTSWPLQNSYDYFGLISDRFQSADPALISLTNTYNVADQMVNYCQSSGGGGSFPFCPAAGSIIAGHWNDAWVCFVARADGLATPYWRLHTKKEGASEQTNATAGSRGLTGLRHIVIGNGSTPSTGGCAGARIAHFACWSSDLGATVASELCAGANPVAYPTNLLWYYPLTSDGTEGSGSSVYGTLSQLSSNYSFNGDNPTVDPSNPIITDFGDENHQWGETGLVITGTNFGT